MKKTLLMLGLIAFGGLSLIAANFVFGTGYNWANKFTYDSSTLTFSIDTKVTPDVGAVLSVQNTGGTCYINAISKSDTYSGFTMGGTGDVDAAGITYDASAGIMYLGSGGTYNVMQFTNATVQCNKPFVPVFVDTGTAPTILFGMGRTAQGVVYIATATVDAASWQKIGAQ